ncbi:MAG: radical SAM protein [Sulfolobales archaeon]
MSHWRVIRPFDPWNSPLCTCPFKWTVNPYTGCGHGCLYCYASSYIPNFFKPRPKESLLTLARRDLMSIPKGSVIELSASSDPFQPLEQDYKLTYRLSEEILSRGYKILYTTKAPNILIQYKDLLRKYKDRIAVAVTITTIDDKLASVIEPNAPPPSARLEAIRELTRIGVPVTVRLDPIIPYINDDEKNLENVVKSSFEAGALQITSSTYKAKPDNFKRVVSAFPQLRERLKELYYVEGEYVRGYRYLPKKIRLEILTKVREYAVELGLKFATCREGLAYLHTKATVCDGSGFIRSSEQEI